MSTRNLKGDIFGGLTAGVVALPLALAFGDQTELGAIAGLYGAIIVGFFAALLGGTPTQVSGPTAPMTLVALSVILSAKKVAGSTEEGMWMIILTFMLAGILQIVFGIAKFGNYIKYIPYPVVSGFMSGIGAIIFLQQIFPLFGGSNPGGAIEIFSNLPALFGNLNPGALILGIGTIGIIYGLPRITKVIPASLVALVVMTVVSLLAFFQVPTIGEIPGGLPKLQLDKFSNIALSKETIQFIIQYGLSLALLGYDRLAADISRRRQRYQDASQLASGANRTGSRQHFGVTVWRFARSRSHRSNGGERQRWWSNANFRDDPCSVSVGGSFGSRQVRSDDSQTGTRRDSVDGWPWDHRLQGIEAHEQGSTRRCDCCLLYTSPSPRDLSTSRMPSSA